MTKEELNAALYGKMQEKQATYKDRLESLPPNEILGHSYEYTVRQDILFAMEYTELEPKQCEALLRSPCHVSDILRNFEKLETGYMDTIRDCIEGRANRMIELEKEKEAR